MISTRGDETQDGAGDEINIGNMKNDDSPHGIIELHIGYNPQMS